VNQQRVFVKQAIGLVKAEQLFAVGFPERCAVLIVETINMTIAQIQQPLSLAKRVIDGVILLTRLAPVFALAFRQKFLKASRSECALFQKLRYQRMNNGLFNAQCGFAFVQIIRRAEPVMIFWCSASCIC
jgi:hypothetical protein